MGFDRRCVRHLTARRVALSERELIRDTGAIGRYGTVRTRRSSVSDDPELSGADDPAAVDPSAEREGHVAGSTEERSDSRDDGSERADTNGESDGSDGNDGGDRDDEDGSEELFEEDFASAFGGGSGGSETGGPEGLAGGDDSGFDGDDEAFESAIPRVDFGIEGLDEMIRGGVPERSLIAVIGSAGTGKTTVGLQFLREGLCDDERAIFIALEESREAVLDTAGEKNWEFERYCEEDRLAVVDLDPVEMATSLRGIRSDLPRLIAEFGASRVVLDSVSLLETMYDDPAKRRTEIFAFARSLKEAGVTTLLTSEASEDTAYASRYGIVEYLTDAVFVLQYVRPSDFQETRLAVEIQKIRNASHSRETKPYEITDTGISVYRRANIF
ncbi:KaiC domain-containing protein [Halobacteriales archaeon QH_6_64_20]|nr:MAG: KaiC domain-containing protein [Halobacteriales archaeon QH_6_64_20]